MTNHSLNATNGSDSLSVQRLAVLICLSLLVGIVSSKQAFAQLGGMGGGGQGAGAAPGGAERPKFREILHDTEGLVITRQEGDQVVASVRVVGNRVVARPVIERLLQTRKDRFYDYETVLGDVRRLTELGSFETVRFNLNETPEGMQVIFNVRERPVITNVSFFGNMALGDRELKGRAGVASGDPLSPFSIESAGRRLEDYYREEGFNTAVVTPELGGDLPAGFVKFNISEGPKERIAGIRILGSTIVSESRLKQVISSNGPMAKVIPYINNVVNMDKINQDVKTLQSYFINLGYLTATVGRSMQWDETGKWLTLTFVVNEGPRFTVNEVQIIGNQYITEDSLRARLELLSGSVFDGIQLRKDVYELVSGYGELGFIYAEINPKTIIRDENGTVDLIYEITEGDRWRIAEFRVEMGGDVDVMKEQTILNMLELKEGDIIDRRKLELDQRRLNASPLLESDLNIAEAPDIKVVPRDQLR